MGTPEMVVKRAWPCSSRFTPVGAPIGFSGAFSSVGASVFSAHFFSASEGWRFSNTSASGFSATCGFNGFFSMQSPMVCLDDREAQARGQGVEAGSERPVGRVPGHRTERETFVLTFAFQSSAGVRETTGPEIGGYCD